MCKATFARQDWDSEHMKGSRMETYVLCEIVSEGLRPGEVTVMVKSTTGRGEYLRLSKSNLLIRGTKHYLGVGVVHIDPASEQHLIEFPHEADSGTSRIWVPKGSIFIERVPA